MARGKLIVLEGIDGSGTTTQSGRLTRSLEARGLKTHATCEPSKGSIGRELREVLRSTLRLDPTAVALLFAADRIDHLRREIEPALAAGVHVISDRYVMSSLAYQSMEVDREFVASINARAPAADLTLLLDVPVEVAEARRKARGGPEELFDATEFQMRVRQAYLEEAKRAGVAILDGTGTQNSVFAAILERVDEVIAP